MMEKPIYMDYMATTPVDPRVIEVMLSYMGPESCFGNPASVTHIYGREANHAVESARSQVASLIGASPEEIIFTSGATEADNLAIIGAAHFYQRKGRHMITMATEHKAVLDSFKHLEREGFHVSYLNPESDGILDLEKLKRTVCEDTILVSIMHVNNEIGVIQDIQAIAECLKGKGILFHVDAAQSVGKLPIDLQTLPVDLMSLSAHKIYGPKGVGALYVRQKPRVRIEPQSYGGGHENGMRSGTLATHQIVGMGEACQIAQTVMMEEQRKILHLRNYLLKGIQHLPGLSINGSLSQRIAGNLNLRFEGLENTALLMALKSLAISTTSACVSSKAQPSYVLKSLGLSEAEAQSSLRLSLGRYTTEKDMTYVIELMNEQIPQLIALKESL